MTEHQSIREGQIIKGSLFDEPMRVEMVRAGGHDTWVLGLVGTQSERFRREDIDSWIEEQKRLSKVGQMSDCGRCEQ
jgi:hypothetical protein